jgi:hypothetical protein
MVVVVEISPGLRLSQSSGGEGGRKGEGVAARVSSIAAPSLLYIEEETWRRRSSTTCEQYRM